MEGEKSALPYGKLLLMGGALFSMHFGGSSMIWPMTWGQQSGKEVLTAFSGAFLTALLFPFLGYFAVSRGKGTFYQISSRVSKRFADIFCGLTILVLGPLFVIPRMSAAAWDAFLQVSGYRPSSMVPGVLFSILYYVIVYWFISKKSQTVDKLSKILFPLLIISIVSIFIKGFITPLSQWTNKFYSEPAFVYGFVQGYATMELPCALVFAAIIINDLKSKGVEGKKLNKNLLIVGAIGISMLTISHFCHMLMGSLSGDLFKTLNYSSLYAKVVMALWGPVGGAVFNIALLFAALTTAIGLTAATCEYFEEVSVKVLTYGKTAIATLVISTIISSIGLNSIVKFAAPILDIIYPAAITLTLYYSLIPNVVENILTKYSLKWAVMGAFAWGIFEGIIGYVKLLNISAEWIIKVHNDFPLAEYNLGWVLITLTAGVMGILYGLYAKNKIPEEQLNKLEIR